MEDPRKIVLSSGFQVNFTDEFIERLTLQCLKYDVLRHSYKRGPMDKNQQTMMYAIGSALDLDTTAADMQEIMQFLRRELYDKARSYAREDDGLCGAPAWLHEAAWRMRLLPVEHLPAPADAAATPASAAGESGFQLSARAMRALLRRLRQTLIVVHDPVVGVIWQDVRDAVLQKFRRLLEVGDLVPENELLTDFEWRVIDLVLLYDEELYHCVITENSLKRHLQRLALVATCDVAFSHRVDEREGRAEIARRWGRAHEAYTAKGLHASLVLLQRRWFELKQRAACAAGAGGAAGAAGAECTLLARVARHVARKPAAAHTWRDLVRIGMVFTDQDVIENDIQYPAPSQSPEGARRTSIRGNMCIADLEKIIAKVKVKVEKDSYEKEWVLEEEREGVGGEEMCEQVLVKTESHIEEINPMTKNRKVVPLLMFEDDYEYEPDEITSTALLEEAQPAKRPKVQEFDTEIDPKLLMDARVHLVRCDLEVMKKQPHAGLAAPAAAEELDDESSRDSGDEWVPSHSGSASDSDDSAAGAGDDARPVTLRDIDEVRRLTQLKLTAQVAPVPPAPLVPPAPPAHTAPPAAPPAAVAHIAIKKENMTEEETESTYNNNELPCVAVKVTNYCPFGSKSTRFRYGEAKTKRERLAAKKNNAKTESISASNKKKTRKKMEQLEPSPEPECPEIDLREWIRQRNLNSRYFGPAPVSLSPVVVVEKAPSETGAEKVETIWKFNISANKNKKTITDNRSASASRHFQNNRKIAPKLKTPVVTCNSVPNNIVTTTRTSSHFAFQPLMPPLAPITFTRPLTSQITTVTTTTAGHSTTSAQVSAFAQMFVPTSGDISVTTNAASHALTTAQMPMSIFNLLATSEDVAVTTNAAGQASTPAQMSAAVFSLVPTSGEIAVPNNAESQASTSALAKSREIPVITYAASPASTSAQSPASMSNLVQTPENIPVTTYAPIQATTIAQMPESVLKSLLKSKDIVATKSAAGQPSTRAQSPASIPTLVLKPGEVGVIKPATDKTSTSVQSPASIPRIVLTPGNIGAIANATSQPSTSAQPSVPFCTLVLTAGANTTAISELSTSAQTTIPLMTTAPAASATLETVSRLNDCIPAGLVLHNPSQSANHNFAYSEASTVPVLKLFVTPAGMPPWTIDQLTNKSATVPPAIGPVLQPGQGQVVVFPDNELDSCTTKLQEVNKIEGNDDSMDTLKDILTGRLDKVSYVTHTSTDSLTTPISIAATSQHTNLLGNSVTVQAYDYVNSLNHKKLRVICKGYSVPFWIVANEYLVLTDDPSVVVDPEPTYYTLAPPEETARIVLDFDGEEAGTRGAGVGAGVGAGDGGVVAPARLLVEGKTYQKLCNCPLRYAQVLGAVRDVAQCRRAQAQGRALHLYSRRTRAMLPLRSVRQLRRLLPTPQNPEEKKIQVDAQKINEPSETVGNEQKPLNSGLEESQSVSQENEKNPIG